MKISKDSLLIKIIFYNTIAIVVTSISVAFITTFISYEDMEARLADTAREKIYIVEKAYSNYISDIKDDLNQVLKDGTFISLQKKGKDNRILAHILKNDLTKKDFHKYYKVEIGILDKNGYLLGKSEKEDIFEYKKSAYDNSLKKLLDNKNYLMNKNNKIYSRVVMSYKNYKNENEYIILSIPFDLNIVQYIKEYVELGSKDKMFLFLKENYITGDFNFKNTEDILTKKSFEILDKNKYEYYYTKKRIEKKPYYISILSLKDYNRKHIGTLGIAISRENLFATKFVVGIFTTIIVISLIMISTTLFNKVFKKILMPLKNITDSAEKISSGDYSTKIKTDEATGEIKLLAISLRRMLSKLEENQRTLKQRNKKLKENLNKMNTIEQLILGIQMEDDVSITVKKIMLALISELGLGFSRGMFFRYSRERNALIGEYAEINSHILEINNDILKEKKGGFEFQLKELQDIVQFIKIPFSNENIISDCLKNKTIKYFNDKGYKYNLGNDLFNSLGLNNFLIFPIYNIDYYSGVMIFDYYIKEKEISEEDIELLKILLMNVSIKLKNKVSEEERLEEERNLTINKVAERFLNTREEALNKLLRVLENTKDKNYESMAESIKDIEDKVQKMKKVNKILMDYSNPLDREKLEKVNIEHLIPEVIEEFKKGVDENKLKQILISSFVSYTGDVLGNDKRLRKVFLEILKNAYDSVINNDKIIKKIDIIVIRDKHSNKIKIDIKDNGIGMTEEQLSNISQPFISYKEDAHGLGVPLIERVIKDCKGVVKFHSEKNVGTTVKITLNIFKEEN